MQTLQRSIRILLLLVVAGMVCPVSLQADTESPAAGAEPPKRFTIQTGTFASYGQSLRQFMELARKMDRNVLDDLRVERLEKFYVVRLSSHDRIEETYRKLALVRETVPDAFAMNESPGTDAQTVYLYPDVAATSDTYTVEAARYQDLDAARTGFAALKERVPEDLRQRLKLERQDKALLVSMGPFDTFVMARKVQRLLGELTGTRAVLRERTPGEGTELLTPGQDSEQKTKADGVAQTSPDPPGQAVEPFEADEIVKPLENIEATMNGFLDEKEYGKAIEVIKRAIERWPDNPDLYAWYGTVLMEMDRPDKALEHYQKAAELAPAVPEYQSNIGYGYLHMQRTAARQSINAFNRALSIDPENSDALEGLGTVYVGIGRKDLAVGIHEELKLLDPEAARRLQEFIRYGIDMGEQTR